MTLPERLAVTLRILASGSTQKSVADSYKMGATMVSMIVSEVCQAIWKTLKADFVSVPKGQEWADIARHFWREWNFPNCLGCVDGRHVHIKAPQREGKITAKSFSWLCAMPNIASRWWTLVHMGGKGIETFSRVQLLDHGCCRGRSTCPDLRTYQATVLLPHFFLGDAAFPLHTNMMQPYSGTIINFL